MRSPLLAAILLFSLILAVAIGMVLILRGSGSSSPIDSLPRDTSFVLRATDPQRLCRDLSRTRMMSRGDRDAWDALAEVVARALESRGVPWSPPATAIMQATRREALVALVPGDAEEPAGLALVLDLGRAAATAPEVARSYVHETLGARGDAAWISRTHHGREYLTLRLPGSPGGLCVAGLKGLGIVATSGASMRRILDTVDGRIESLRSDAAYRVTRDRLGKRADLLAYASGAWLKEMLERRITPSPQRRALKLLGLEAVRGVGLEIDLPREMFRERLFIAQRGDGRGLPGELFDASPRAFAASASIPAGFPFYASLSYSGLDSAYRKLPEILSGATGEDRREIRARLMGLEQFMALDLEHELFGALGEELLVGFGGASPFPRSASNRALLNTPAVAVASLKNQSAIGHLLERIDGLARAMTAYRSMTRDGQPITAYDFTDIAPLSPAYRLVRGRLIAATSPDLLAQALNAGARHLSIADQPDLEALVERLPERSHIYFLGDTARIADLLQPRLRSAPSPDFLPGPLRAGLVELPQETGLPPTAAAARMTQAGVLIDWISPVSPSLLLSLWLAADAGEDDEMMGNRIPAASGEIPY